MREAPARRPLAGAPTGLPRLLRGMAEPGAASLRSHLDQHGELPLPARRRGPDETLIRLVEASGLRGRGGAGFPTARKLEAVARAARGGTAVVVADGSEGEPASGKDKLLLSRAPHLVLDGAQVAARAVGATKVIVAASYAHPDVLAGLERAVAERAAAGLDRLRTQVVATPERFVAGEETALVRFLGGGPAKPTFVPPRPFERGLGGRPTLVHNVETLAHLALVARHGADWFAAMGPAAEPGSTLVTVTGAVHRPGVYEIARGTVLSHVLAGVGGITTPLQAFLLGGYGGTWMAAEAIWEVPLSEGELRALGGTLGAGIVIALPRQACGVVETAAVAGYLAGETAGQCGPCVNGLDAIASALWSLAEGRSGGAAVGQLRRWTALVHGRGACHHPDGAARLVQSALRVFAADIAAHCERRPCPGAEGHPVLAVPVPAHAGQGRS